MVLVGAEVGGWEERMAEGVREAGVWEVEEVEELRVMVVVWGLEVWLAVVVVAAVQAHDGWGRVGVAEVGLLVAVRAPW